MARPSELPTACHVGLHASLTESVKQQSECIPLFILVLFCRLGAYNGKFSRQVFVVFNPNNSAKQSHYGISSNSELNTVQSNMAYGYLRTIGEGYRKLAEIFPELSVKSLHHVLS